MSELLMDFSVVLDDESQTEVGGATALSDAVVLAAAVFGRSGVAVMVLDTGGVGQAWVGRATDAAVPSGDSGIQLDSVNPASTPVGLAPQIIIATGSGFQDGATLHWAGLPQETTFNSEDEVAARIEDPYEHSPGEQISVQVENPDGNVSGTVYFLFEQAAAP